MKNANLSAGLLLQVHDELLLSAAEKEAEQTAEILKNSMENVLVLSVPLEVSLKAGKDYYSVK